MLFVMAHLRNVAAVFIFSAFLSLTSTVLGCTGGQCQLGDKCSADADCAPNLYCLSCIVELEGRRCVRSNISDQFKLVNNSLPFNRYSFLTTHNSFAIDGEPLRTGIPRITFTNQEDNVTEQLNHGVRALMLDTYDFDGDVWLCHSFEGKCHDYTAFEPALDTLKEIEAFFSANPTEIITLILEDYVQAPNGLTNVFNNAGLMKYWFPVSKMPQNGQDWPLVSDMVANNQRLIVFTSAKSKQETEGIAYQWNYMVENQYGDEGLGNNCNNRAESAPLTDNTKSLVLVNHFGSIPVKEMACGQNSESLMNTISTCHTAAGNRWANFIAVDYFKILSMNTMITAVETIIQRSDGGGSVQAVDTLNGELLCGCNDVHACATGSSGTCRR